MKEATWVQSLDLKMQRRRCKTLREGPSRKNDKMVDEGINSTWREKVLRTKHEQSWDHYMLVKILYLIITEIKLTISSSKVVP